MGVLFGYLGILIIVGALLCFKGRDLFRPVIAVFAFWLVYSTVTGLLHTNSDKDLIIAVLAGLVAALLSGFVLKIGIFLAGMVMGLSLGKLLLAIFPQIQQMTIPPVVFLALVTILVGILTVKAIDLIIMIATSGIGATLIGVPCVFIAFHVRQLSDCISTAPVETIENVNNAMFSGVAMQQPMVVLCVTAALCIAGIVVQYKTNRKTHK